MPQTQENSLPHFGKNKCLFSGKVLAVYKHPPGCLFQFVSCHFAHNFALLNNVGRNLGAGF